MRLLTLREAAAALKVSESTIRRWIREGSLTAYKVGKRGQLRLRAEELESFLEKHRIQASATNDISGGD